LIDIITSKYAANAENSPQIEFRHGFSKGGEGGYFVQIRFQFCPSNVVQLTWLGCFCFGLSVGEARPSQNGQQNDNRERFPPTAMWRCAMSAASTCCTNININQLTFFGHASELLGSRFGVLGVLAFWSWPRKCWDVCVVAKFFADSPAAGIFRIDNLQTAFQQGESPRNSVMPTFRRSN